MAGMKVAVGMHEGQCLDGCMTGDAEALPKYEVKTLITLDHTACQVLSSG